MILFNLIIRIKYYNDKFIYSILSMDYDNIDKIREERNKIFENIDFTEKALRNFTDIKPIIVSNKLSYNGVEYN